MPTNITVPKRAQKTRARLPLRGLGLMEGKCYRVRVYSCCDKLTNKRLQTMQMYDLTDLEVGLMG